MGDLTYPQPSDVITREDLLKLGGDWLVVSIAASIWMWARLHGNAPKVDVNASANAWKCLVCEMGARWVENAPIVMQCECRCRCECQCECVETPGM